jgi:hypothetical protein
MAAPSGTYRYGPTGLGLEAPTPVPRPVLIPAPTPGAMVRRGMRRLWDEEPVMEMTRRQLESEAIRSGIAGRSGSFSRIAAETGYSQALQRLAGPRETGPLAEAYKRAWGRPFGNASMF